MYKRQGDGESTQDVVYGGHDLIAENGTLLAQSTSFTTGIIYADLDIAKLRMERRKMTTYLPREDIPVSYTHLSSIQTSRYSSLILHILSMTYGQIYTESHMSVSRWMRISTGRKKIT